jgi:hypothetical protein
MTDQEVLYVKESLDLMLADSSMSDENKERLIKISQIFDPVYESAKRKSDNKKYDKIKFSYMNFSPSVEISKAINVFSGAAALYEIAVSDLEAFDKITQDILHAVEMAELTEEEKNSLFDELREVRQKRRICKNFLEQCKELYEFAKGNKQLTKHLQSIASNVGKIKEAIETRKYYPRELTALEAAFEKANGSYLKKEKVVG